MRRPVGILISPESLWQVASWAVLSHIQSTTTHSITVPFRGEVAVVPGLSWLFAGFAARATTTAMNSNTDVSNGLPADADLRLRRFT